MLKKAELASKKAHYSSLMKYLKKIRAFPEGKRHAQEIAIKWKIQYKRRPAMQDELRRAGFYRDSIKEYEGGTEKGLSKFC